MGLPATSRVTYDDYLLLPEDRRYELIDGGLLMTPAPQTYHQLILRNLEYLLHGFVSSRSLGEIYFAPCDVVLSDFDVVQPDLLFVSAERRSIIGESAIVGAPDLVVEILSPSTATRDRVLKPKLYARAGVQELWLVDPAERSIEVLRNSPGGFRRYAEYALGEEGRDILRSPMFPELRIPLREIF